MDELTLFWGIWALSFGLILIPQSWKTSYTLILAIGIGIVTSNWAFQVLSSQDILILAKTENVIVQIDQLSAIFLLILNLTSITGAIYGVGYMRAYLDKPTWQLSIHGITYLSLQVAMISVVILPGGFPFLTAWEMMALSSFLLVIFESDKKMTLRTGIMYLFQMHIAFFLILSAFLWLNSQTGSMDFIAISEIGNNQTWLFLLFMAGFGIKAGFIPLHTWLPHAHPAAPSHVSGVMSGVMIKTGIYGILRVLLQIEHQYLFVLGIGMIVLSVLTGLLGVIFAIVQHDLKKLLAYHSIENIGIIGIGIGLGMLGSALDIPALAILGYGGGIMHVLNHSLFKSLLFYGAGSVYIKTHTRNVEHLGGLIKKMPQTAVLFLIGSLAICGLPPFNGFISEFILYKGMFDGFGNHGLGLNLLLLGAAVGLVLIGGLAIFCFTKAFGLVFLGSPRTEASQKASKEVGIMMRLPQYVIVIIILSIGIFPEIYWNPIQQVISQFYSIQNINNLDLSMLAMVGRTSALLLALIAGLWLVRRWQQSKAMVTQGPAWGCGYTGGNASIHQYTATSYTQNFVELVEPVVNVKTVYTSFDEEEIFPQPRSFHTHQSDPMESKAIQPTFLGLLKGFQKLAVLQTGKIQHYLIYPLFFLGLIVILTLLEWI